MLLLKVLLFFILFATFFVFFGIENEWLLRLSRTAAVTMLTFVVLGSALMSIYGGYSVGITKSKPIIYSMTLSTVFTDIVTHLQLCIMNTNAANNQKFQYEHPLLLLLVMVIQILVIIFFAYFGNFVYFSINSPEKCCVITTSKYSLNNIIPKIKKYKKQYLITDAILFTNPDLFDIINRCDTVFVYDVPAASRTTIVEYCYANNKNIYYNFEMCDVVSLRGKNAMLDDKPMIASTVKGLTVEQRIMKRAMDLFVSTVGLIITSPIMLACAIAIKAEDGGSVFFKQKRATKDGKIFKVYKFRIDELPQIINIFKGEMSVVGPRPEMIENVDEYTQALPEFSYRLRVKAGLTGLAQIAGKYNTSPKDKLVLDLMYIEKYSIWQDIKLIFQTLTVFFKADDSTEAFHHSDSYEFFTADESPKLIGEPENAESNVCEQESKQ